MSMTINISIRNARLQVIIDAIKVGSGDAKLLILDGVRPAAGGAITNILAEFIIPATVGAVAEGILTFDPIADELSANAAGDATWGRVINANGDYVMDGNCGLAASGAEFIVNKISVLLGALVTVEQGSIVEGNA